MWRTSEDCCLFTSRTKCIRVRGNTQASKGPYILSPWSHWRHITVYINLNLQVPINLVTARCKLTQHAGLSLSCRVTYPGIGKDLLRWFFLFFKVPQNITTFFLFFFFSLRWCFSLLLPCISEIVDKYMQYSLDEVTWEVQVKTWLDRELKRWVIHLRRLFSKVSLTLKTYIHYLNKESFIQCHSPYTVVSTEKEWHTVLWNVPFNTEHHDHLLSKVVK